MPCVSTPRRSALTRQPATMAASSSGTPCAARSRRTKASASSARTWTRPAATASVMAKPMPLVSLARSEYALKIGEREGITRSMTYATDFQSIRDQVSPEEWQSRLDLAACYRLVDHFGMTDLIYNHVTARIPGTDDHLLINLYGLLYKE